MGWGTSRDVLIEILGVLDFGEFSIEFYRILGYFEAVIIATDSLGGELNQETP